MSKETLEHISSLMDGELSPETGLFLTRRLCADPGLGQTWRRYHLIRDCLRRAGGGETALRADFSIDELLGKHARAGAGQARSLPAWLRPVAGFAIAASVAVVAVIAVAPAPGPVDNGPPLAPFSSPNTLPAVPASQAASFSASSTRARQLNEYLLRHNQVSGSASRQGFVSLIPIVTTTQAQEEPGTEVEESSGPEAAEATDQADRQD